MRSSNIGGQAVLEGIMMRNGGKYSVAVRKPDGEIESEVWDYHSVIPWKVLLKIPFIRGIFNFVGFSCSWNEDVDVFCFVF